MLNQTQLFSCNPSTSIKENSTLLDDHTAKPLSSNSYCLGPKSILRSSRTGMTGLHRTESLTGLDRFHQQDIPSTSKDPPPPPPSQSSTSFLFDIPSSTSGSMTFTFGDNHSSSLVISSSNAPTTPFTFSLSKPAITTTTTSSPKLFSTMNPSKKPLSRPSGLFQTTVKTPIFNEELAYLTCYSKSKVTVDRPRSKQLQLYSTTLPKASKRKYDESIIDDDEDALFSTSQLPKMNIKRPRMLDMNKIRSIVLGTNETTHLQKSSIDKHFSTYEEYLSTKKIDSRAFRLPRLTHHDYYTEPAIEELQSYFNDQGQCFVNEFTIIRKHYGSVTFQGLHMNLAGLDLDRLVQIDRRQVTIYPDETDRPNEGEELNCQAIISLIGVYPIDRSKCQHSGEEVTDPQRLLEMNYGNYLEEMTKKFQGHFLDYDVHTGTWSFRVEHF